MHIALTPAQFSAIEEKLGVTQGITLTQSAPDSGTLLTHDVTLGYSYDGAGILNIEIIAKHSLLAKMATEATIEDHINQIFSQSLAP